jgi:alpha-D-ribose 1-methylphosphonate 5-triphosphate synthase subunit PhnL
MGEKMIKVTGLSKMFRMHILNGKIIEGFKDVSFSVKPGQAMGIKGKSGKGKSSVLKCIYRTYIPSSGNIIYESGSYGYMDLAHANEHEVISVRKSEISFITQFLHIIPRISALDVVAEPLVGFGAGAAESREKAAALLSELGIPEGLFDAFPSTFSGGEKQRINIARSVIKVPRLLLMDEPTASLDRKSTEIVVKLLRGLKAKGTTMIGAFHDMRVMEQISDSIYEMDGGL